ncbi:uncharacterized protein F5147DRAFT_783055 [Suillus discolor]|uniref:Uncharacterized protein n=1 Tax=Suillus discolor TaxID=1912936 RepID=A0A9P7ERR2_9AGAM|nr:uncharacterized protein F5147DRAFT_783055 [Suillus discolor]KAG2083045.1 hypothetical protein F5147DRAFT_783055 [Suillus discolor]
MNAAGNNRRRQCNLRRQQDRDEIRQQAQAELMAAGMQPPQVPHIPNEPAPPVLAPAPLAPAPAPVYGPIHYEGAVGPHNFENPLHYFLPNPIPPPPPEHNYHQFNVQFQHHLEEERIRNDLLQRQAQEEFHGQQIQQQFQQQEAERIRRQAQEELEAFHMQQQEAERHNRQDLDIQRAGQQAEERQRHQEQRNREQQEHLEEALREYDNPAVGIHFWLGLQRLFLP